MKVFKHTAGGFVALVLLSIALSACGTETDTDASKAGATTAAETGAPEAETTEAEAEEEPEETAGQQNARESAENYLDTAAFSQKGLIKQLKFEGYTAADALYAVKAVSPDWNEQAAKSAETLVTSTRPRSRKRASSSSSSSRATRRRRPSTG